MHLLAIGMDNFFLLKVIGRCNTTKDMMNLQITSIRISMEGAATTTWVETVIEETVAKTSAVTHRTRIV